MCGIVGTNFKSNNFHHSIELLEHRGPDNMGFCEYQNNQFGHTRLSIIDLDAEANQPMEFDNIIITFNGEIYNYQALIKEEDLTCKTSSDTEVLIRLYQKYGTDFLNKLNGMFSFCIYDKNKDIFFCARDRFGKKPFYYYFKDDKFIYASEIKSIVKILNTTPHFNRKALEEYLTFWTPIKNNTFYNDIKKLQGGYSLLLAAKNMEINKYYDIENIETKYFNEKETLNDIEELLHNSISRRLVGNVEVASLLSGGIDSSFISALYSKISTKKISTYCIGYDEHLHYSELSYAKKVSKYINSNHAEVIINKKEYLETINAMLYHSDEPLGDSACIPLYLLSKKISSDGYKVALSGEGSDENFLGYDKYFSLLHSKEQYLTINSAFNENEKTNLFKKYKKENYNFLKKYKSNLKQFTYVDMKIWTSELLMSKVDKMSMAHSVEIRTPFLDYHLVEYLLGVDEKIKQGDTNKYLLKQIAKKYLPAEIINRRKKGFSSPSIEWLYHEYKDDILYTILRVNKKLNIFNEDFIKFIYNEAKEKRYKQHLWNLYIFARWFEKTY
ncbi:asparagine synthase (glutamine-hydrolyzing) [Arcobacter sp. HD9-500m-PIT-SAG03]|nr:asparagine synthase (glutamine-hydrolyzing) [Arcobacter sp. HD9-500m-PIT-SAG03]